MSKCIYRSGCHDEPRCERALRCVGLGDPIAAPQGLATAPPTTSGPAAAAPDEVAEMVGKLLSLYHGIRSRIGQVEGLTIEDAETAKQAATLFERLGQRSDLVQVTRTFLESLKCPTPGCDGSGWITNTGPDPQHDGCPWCEARERFLNGDLPPAPGASDD